MHRTIATSARLTLALLILLTVQVSMTGSSAAAAGVDEFFTRADGYFPGPNVVTSAEIVPGNASEEFSGIDFNDDGDLSDGGLFYYRRSTNTVTFVAPRATPIIGSSDRTIAFMIHEYDTGLHQDFDSDGIVDGDTLVLGLVDVTTNHVWFPLLPDRIENADTGNSNRYPAYQFHEQHLLILLETMGYVLFDLDDYIFTEMDVDHADALGERIVVFGSTTLTYYDMVADETIDTGEALTVQEDRSELHLRVVGRWIKFTNYEPSLGQDLNGDGELGSVGGVYDTVTRRVRYLPIDGKLALDGRVYFSQWEWDADLNGDGDIGDNVVGYYDLATSTITAYETSVTVDLRAIDGNTILGTTSEDRWDRDLNGDGRIDQYSMILVYFTLPPIDTTKPTVTITAPTASTYLLKQRVIADYACQDEDAGSDIASCLGKGADGSRIGTNTIGAKTYWVHATDTAGNLRRKQIAYTVAYGICTTFDEERGYDARRTIPITLQLCDANGTNVSGEGVRVRVVGLTPGPLPDDARTRFRYNDADNAEPSYTYWLALSDLQVGEHTLSFMAGGDPTIHTLQFHVTRNRTTQTPNV